MNNDREKQLEESLAEFVEDLTKTLTSAVKIVELFVHEVEDFVEEATQDKIDDEEAELFNSLLKTRDEKLKTYFESFRARNK